MAKYLVENGANIESKNATKETALSLSKLLYSNIYLCDFNKYFIFVLAMRRGHLDFAKYLIEKGANINEKNNYGPTAFHKGTKICRIF